MRPVWLTLTALMVIALFVDYSYRVAKWSWIPCGVLAVIFLILSFLAKSSAPGEA